MNCVQTASIHRARIEAGRGTLAGSFSPAPNALADDQRPVDLLDTDLPAVLAAARADRFVATG